MANERQQLIEALKVYHDSKFTPGVYGHSIIGLAALMLENSVKVVRCKDCKHWHEGTAWCDKHSHFDEDEWNMFDADDFCSYGERRTK